MELKGPEHKVAVRQLRARHVTLLLRKHGGPANRQLAERPRRRLDGSIRAVVEGVPHMNPGLVRIES
jgi:hypothetical protein